MSNTITTRTDKAKTTACREQERVITYLLCYWYESEGHKIQSCNKKNNIFVTNNERNKMKEEEVRGIVEEYREVKSLNLRFHTNNTRNEALICLPTEKRSIISYNRYQHLQRIESRTVFTNQDIKRIWERDKESR